MEEPGFSLVIPMFDEEENVDPLIDELIEVLPSLGPCEVIVVDDGSRDRTRDRLLARRRDLPWLRVLSLRKNVGQSGALCAGFENARAPILLMMDGDLQNDPRDFAEFVRILDEADCVSGIRTERRDSWVRRISSRIANSIRNLFSGDWVVDSASGIKGFRTDLLKKLPRFDGMHRFLPTLARMAGGKVVEIPVRHRPRSAGKGKYGIGNRAVRAFIDLLAVRWMRKRWIKFDLREE